MRDGTAGGRLAKTIGCAGWDRIAESFAESGGIRALARIVLAGMNPQGEDLLKLLGGMGPQGDLVAIRLLTGLHLELFPSGL